jgi:hypothetical protein
MSFQIEFPDYDPATMPTAPEGFEDCSWHNDLMPHFLNTALGLDLFIDYADPAMRESYDATGKSAFPRFQLYATTNDGTWIADDPFLWTDDWEEIIAMIGKHRAVPPTVEAAAALLEEAVGLLGGEPCNANADNVAWFARVSQFLAATKGRE